MAADPGRRRRRQRLRGSLCDGLNRGKDGRVAAILAGPYAAADIVFLQAAADPDGRLGRAARRRDSERRLGLAARIGDSDSRLG